MINWPDLRLLLSAEASSGWFDAQDSCVYESIAENPGMHYFDGGFTWTWHPRVILDLILCIFQAPLLFQDTHAVGGPVLCTHLGHISYCSLSDKSNFFITSDCTLIECKYTKAYAIETEMTKSKLKGSLYELPCQPFSTIFRRYDDPAEECRVCCPVDTG